MLIDQLIKKIEELEQNGAIGYSAYKELITLAREAQVIEGVA